MADSINRTSFVLNKSCSTVTCPESHWLKIDRATHNAMAAVPVEYRIIDGDPEQPREMTQLEKDAVDAATLPAVRAARIAAMGAEMATYLVSRDYGPEQFKTLLMYHQVATTGGLANRVAHIDNLFNWHDSVTDHFLAKSDDVNAATSAAAVAAVVMDTAQFNATDPGVTIASTKAIAT